MYHEDDLDALDSKLTPQPLARPGEVDANQFEGRLETAPPTDHLTHGALWLVTEIHACG